MEQISPHVKLSIMRRVHFIWFVRRALPVLALEAAVITLVVYKVADQVFVNNVLRNAALHTFSRSPLMLVSFLFRAFLNTEVMVQLFLIAFGIVGALFLKDIRRVLQSTFSTTSRNLLGHFHVI